MTSSPIAQLVFDEPSHTYFLDGVRIPSVTQILEAVGVVDFSYLPPGTRKMALERGRRVHLATQFDDEADLDLDGLDEALLPYVQSWRNWRRDSGFEPTLIEYLGYHPSGYAGRMDRFGKIRSRSLLVDIKTNSMEGWVRLQTAGYAAFLPDPISFERVCVELHQDATYRAITYPGKDFKRDFQDFQSCLAVYRLQERFGRLRNRKERAA